MSVSIAHIWKSAAASVHSSDQKRDGNLHIGITLRGLYSTGTVPTTEGPLEDLLADLDAAEERFERRE